MQGSRGYAPRDNPNLRNSLRGLGFRAFWDVTGERNGTAVALKLVTERDPVLGYVYPPSGSYPMTAPSPAPGAPLYLDGLLYLLGGSVSRTYEDGPLTHRFYERPAAPDPETEALWAASVNYKASGTICDERDLRWVTRAEFLAMAREQADALLRGGTTQLARLWGNAAYDAIAEVVPTWPEAFFVLPGRCLIDPPCLLVDENGQPSAGGREPRMVAPTSAAHALELARGALNHSFYAAPAAAEG